MTSVSQDSSERRWYSGLLLDLTPFRQSRAFTRLWLGTTLGNIGQEMTVVTVSLQVYHLTSSTFAVSAIAGIALAPIIVMGLYGGTLADRFDRRRVALIANVIGWLAVVALAAHALVGGTSLWVVYLAATVNSVANTIAGITRRAIIPRLLPNHLLPAAGALNGITFGLMATVGPLVGATAVGLGGFQSAYLLDLLLHSAAFLGIWALPALRPKDSASGNPLCAVRDGLAFLRSANNVRFSLAIDLVAMVLAQPRVLFPALGAVTLGGGVATVGVLSAASAAGTVCAAFFSGWTGRVRRQGVAIVVCTYVYGAAITGAGVVILLAVTLPRPDGTHVVAIAALTAALAISGVADSISVIFRGAMLQAAVPDHLRGRVQSIFTIIVTSGPRIGDVLTGAVASIAALWSPLLAGGLIMVAIVWVRARKVPSFMSYDRDDPQP